LRIEQEVVVSVKDLLDLKGIVTVINTPFTQKNTIDVTGLEKNIEYAIQAGVAGFLIPGMASEVMKLSPKEQELLVSTLIKKNDGRKKIICGCYGNNQERIERAKKWIELGCDGIMVNIPYEGNPNFSDEFSEFAKLNPSFLMLQDWSANGYGIPSEIIIKLWKEIDCFKSIKIEVVPAGVKYSEILKLSQGKLHTAGGWAVSQLIEGLDRGVHAFMPTGMHEIYTKIYNLYQNSKRSDAIQLFNEILPILSFSNQHLDISIHFFKRLLYKQGIYNTPNVRKPILDFDEIHSKLADEHIKKVIEITNRIKK
jgi:dihydrodipicolinate synthase/N-acetylneuraminate lyase